MKDFKLVNNENNLETRNFGLDLTQNDMEYTLQKIRIVLGFIFGEWYLNTNIGIPYLEVIFIKNPDIDLIEDLFKAEILGISTVSEIVSFVLEADEQRQLLFAFTVRLTNDELLTIEDII